MFAEHVNFLDSWELSMEAKVHEARVFANATLRCNRRVGEVFSSYQRYLRLKQSHLM